MSHRVLTADDLKAIRGIVIEELDKRAERIGELVVTAVTNELNKHLDLVGPRAADWAATQLDLRIKGVTDAIGVAKEELSRAAAEDSRDTDSKLAIIEGLLVPLGGRMGGLEIRMLNVEKQLKTIVASQHVDIQQGASIRESLMPGEKSAVAETPPAFDGELAVESEVKTDASPPTEAD